ncbi:hypothetical protein Tco_0413037 [Tanacetum coccineum]
MPPRRLKKKSVKRLVEKRVAKAIEEYKKSRANLDGAESSGGNTGNAGGTVNVQGCSHNTFMNGKPHSYNGTEGVVGLRRWIEKVEQVFEICKCAKENKVMFAASTFEGRALTWWNGNVHTLGLVNANVFPGTEFKMMDTTEYCPHEIQRWNKNFDSDSERRTIEAYQGGGPSLSTKLVLMCPGIITIEKKRLKSRFGRQETARVYAAAPAESKGYAGNLPRWNCFATLPTNGTMHQSGGAVPKELVIRRKTAELGFQVQELPPLGCDLLWMR